MEFTLYLVLILGLASVAGCMLYARFSADGGKSLHHPPKNSDAVVAEIHDLEEDPDSSAEEIEADGPVPNELPAAKPTLARIPPVVAEAIPTEKAEEARKSEYLDELQDAAAGLAMLMRSSASNRTTPVVFAPDDAEVESIEVEEEVKVEVEEKVEAEIADSENDIEVPEQAAEPEKKSLEMLLGAEVTDQIGQLDSGLDELEALVGSIESGLALLAPVEVDDSEAIEIAEAA